MQTNALSVMSYEALDDLRAVLAEFEARHHVQVQIVPLPWDTGWTQIVKYALYGDAPAVSEIGSTWVASLAAMNALRPFTEQEIVSMEGEAAFLPAAWHSGQLLRDPTLWAMPWLAETRAIFYWRDVLESDHPIYRVMKQGVQTGRSFPAMRLWGLIEERLTPALGNIWQKILTAGQPDLDEIIQAELDPLAQRLNQTLEMSPQG